MRGRLVSLALLALLGAGCASSAAPSSRPIPGMDDDRRVEQIITPGPQLENK